MSETGVPVGAEMLPELLVWPSERQRRWTVLLRLLLAVPHAIILAFLSIATAVVSVVSWFAALLLGRLPATLAAYQSWYLRYWVRVEAYLYLLDDRYPPFPWSGQPHPVDVILPPPTRLNRFAVFFRFVLAIPAAIVNAVTTIGWGVLALPFWVVVLILGRVPGPVFGAGVALLRYQYRYQAYLTLLTPAYPKHLFGDQAPLQPQFPAPPQHPAQAPQYPAQPPQYPAPPYPAQPYPAQSPQYPAPQQYPAPFPAPPVAAAAPYCPTRPLLLSSGARTLLIVLIVLGVVGYGADAVVGAVVGGTQSTSGAAGSITGGTADQRAVAATIQAYYQALDKRDGDAACALLTPELRQNLADLSSSSGCAGAVDKLHDQVPAKTRSMLAGLRYDASDIDISGDTAHLDTQDLAETNHITAAEGGTYTLTKTHGDWLIDSLG